MRNLLAKEESKMAGHVRAGLEVAGNAVDVAADGGEAIWLAEENFCAAHLLDVTMPRKDGFSVVRQWRRWLPLGLSLSLPQFLRAENQVDYRYEYYDETGQRMKIETHSVYFEQKLADAVIAKGELIYDGISGATPNGLFNQLTGQIYMKEMWDLRRAANLELDCRLGNHTLTPGFAWSSEHDYLSYGISLNDAIEFNDKNTILQLGASHNFDSVRHSDDQSIWNSKDATEGIIGVSQLLSPKDVFNVAFTFGNDSGYLNDPYRSIVYHPDIEPYGFNIYVPERRPAHRNKEILFTTLTHHFNSLDASLEGSYRFYHDSYDVFAHTVGLTWHQWLGKHLMVEPLFRFSQQSAASFYSTLFYGPYPISGNPDGYHSSDYRLSEMFTLDYGLQATVLINDHLRVTAGYHRYEMRGLDNTSDVMYPKANVYSVGLSFLW